MKSFIAGAVMGVLCIGALLLGCVEEKRSTAPLQRIEFQCKYCGWDRTCWVRDMPIPDKCFECRNDDMRQREGLERLVMPKVLEVMPHAK